MLVTFPPSVTENAVEVYRVMFLKSPSGSFSLEDALAVPIENTIEIEPTGSDYSIVPNSTQVDADGNMIEYGTEYRVCVILLNNGLGISDNVGFSNYLTLNGPTGVVHDVILSDIGNSGNATDLHITFEKADKPATVSEYRIYIVPTSMAATFDLEAALDVPAFYYYEFNSDTSGTFSMNFPAATDDITHDPIIENYSYTAFVSSIASEFGTFDTLSYPSNDIILLNTEVGINSNPESDITAYYDNGQLMIHSVNDGLYQIKLLNSSGQVCLEKQYVGKDVFQINLCKGIYFLVLYDGEKRKVIDILVN